MTNITGYKIKTRRVLDGTGFHQYDLVTFDFIQLESKNSWVRSLKNFIEKLMKGKGGSNENPK